MKIESPLFKQGESIPYHCSALAENLSPPLFFHDLPAGTRSLALIVDDPDTGHGTFTHWIVFNLKPDVDGLAENALVTEAHQGTNDTGEIGYHGPKPPQGEHRYFFKLYALDEMLDLPVGARRAEFDRALRGHIVAEAEMMGRFATPPHLEPNAPLIEPARTT